MPQRRVYDEERNAELLEWMQEKLKERDLSQQDLAWMLDGIRRTHPTTVESWFQGKTVPSFPLLVALVSVFGELPPPLQRALSREAAPRLRSTDAWARDVRNGIAGIVALGLLAPIWGLVGR